ncbi:MAG: hypothetical protein LBR17_05965 [Bacteroidales bacterium]|jgi:hypothetical protein|nr:hypothetical protein [Bacteroidales bacterium]
MSKKEKTKLSRILNFITSILICGLLIAMFLTNPDAATVHQKVKEKEGMLSIVDVNKRMNLFLFSITHVDIISLNPRTDTYLGIFGQIVQLN